MSEIDLHEPDAWCALGFLEQRAALAAALHAALGEAEGVREVRVEAGTLGREYDLTAAVETDVGVLRTPLWSHGKAMIFCDPSVHVANRRQLAPDLAVTEAADRLHRRLAVPYTLEQRGLSATMEPEAGVERTWTAERALLRNRTAVTREDRIRNAAPDLDLRDLLVHFYSGPSLRMVGPDGAAFLVPEAAEAEGPVVSLCPGCGRWFEGSHAACPSCGAVTEVVIAARPPRR
jgi:hypothetical protein